MTPPQDPSLGLPEVQERFNASAAALEDVRSKVDELADIASRQDSAAQTLEEASSRVRELAATADATVAALAAAQEVVVEAFAAVQSVMDGSDLNELRDSIDGIEGHFNATSETTVEAIREVEGKLTKMASDHAERLEDILEKMTAEMDGAKDAAGELRASEARAQAMERERDAALAKAAEAESRLERLKTAAGARAVRKAGLEE